MCIRDSIKTLLVTLWKSEDDKVTKTESGELGSAVSAYIERIQSDRSIVAAHAALQISTFPLSFQLVVSSR